ncbi:MAG: DUF3631 domain-containing protein [Streptosporangiaceae bacterium]
MNLDDLDVALDGAQVLDEVHAMLTRYVVFPSAGAADAVTLYAAATHAMPELEFAARLVIRSPVKRCGKSRLLDVLGQLVHKPLITTDISAAALVRSVTEQDPPTIMLDEADAIFGKALKGDEKAENLRGILNAGFGRDRPYKRWDVSTRSVENCPTFAMAVLAGIGAMPDTIEDRAVTLTMRRKAPDEQALKFRLRRDKPKVTAVGDRLAAWVAPLAKELGDAEPQMPEGLNDRAEDAWEALIAIADAAGGPWPARARKAARVLSDAAEEDAADSMRLLADLQAVFGQEDKLWTQAILDALHRIPEAPWGDWYGHPLKDRELANLLKPYGIRSRDVKIGDVNRKGYYREQFIEPWRSYVHAGKGSATGATGATAQANGHISKATDALPERYRAGVADAVAHGSPQVADAKPPLTSDVAEVAQVAHPQPAKAPGGELWGRDTSHASPGAVTDGDALALTHDKPGGEVTGGRPEGTISAQLAADGWDERPEDPIGEPPAQCDARDCKQPARDCGTGIYCERHAAMLGATWPGDPIGEAGR